MMFFKRQLPCMIIAALVFLVFANTLSFPLLKGWDDHVFVIENVQYFNFRPQSLFHLLTMENFGNYIPLVNFSYLLDYSAGGLNGFMYHFQNVLWHVVGCVGLYGCMRLMGVSWVTAFFMTLLYAVHPQRSESVAWISERRDVMCGAFFFWSFFCYIKFRGQKSFPVSAFVLFLCACLSKSVAVTMPAVLVMYEIWKDSSFRPLSKYRGLIPYFVLAFIIAVGTSLLQMNTPSDCGGVEKILRVLHNYSWYFLKNFYPGELAPAYPKIVFSTAVFLKIFLFYLLLSVFSVVLFFRSGKNLLYNFLPLAIAYAVTLLPTIGIVPIGVGSWDYADRYSYIPSGILAAGAALFLDFLAGKLPDGKKFLQFEAVAFSLAVFLFAWITYFYNYTWKSYSRLLAVAVNYDPPNRQFVCMYGVTAFSNKKNAEAEKSADYLLSVTDKDSFDYNGKSFYYTALFMKAAALARRGEAQAAFPLFNESLKYADSFFIQDVSAYIRLLETAANCYLKLGKSKMAVRCYDAIAGNYDGKTISPGLFHFYKGLSFYIKGNLKMAEQEFAEALRLIPEDDYIKANLDEVRRRLKEKNSK